MLFALWTKVFVLQRIVSLDHNGSQSGDGLRRSGAGVLNRARARTLKMTVVIVLVFIFCWTPYYIITLWWVKLWVMSHYSQRIFLLRKGIYLEKLVQSLGSQCFVRKNHCIKASFVQMIGQGHHEKLMISAQNYSWLSESLIYYKLWENWEWDAIQSQASAKVTRNTSKCIVNAQVMASFYF